MSAKQKNNYKFMVLLILMISLLTVSVSAWFDTSQHKTNQLTLKDGIGMVIMTKYGVHSDGTVLSTGLENIEFEFRITFDQDVEARYKIGDSESLPFINGSVISVRNLQEILISGIPFVTRYVIEEIQKENYIMLSERYEGIVMDDIVTIKVFNNYDGPETREGYLEILKHVVGNTTDKVFDFELHVNDEIKPFSLKDGEMVSYTFEKGTHYSVYEKDYRNDGYILTLVDGQGTIEKGVVSEVIATNTYDPSLAQRLYALRKERNKTQEEVVLVLNATRQTVSNWETGNALPSIDKATEITKLYGLWLDEFVGIPVKTQTSDLLLSLIGEKCSIFLRLDNKQREEYAIEVFRNEYKDVKILEVTSKFIRFEYNDKRQKLEKILFLNSIAYVEKEKTKYEVLGFNHSTSLRQFT